MTPIMDVDEFRSRLANHDISRRDINRVLASAGVATVAMPLVASHAQEEEAADFDIDSDLTVFTWSGLRHSGTSNTSYIDKHGTTPAFHAVGEEEEGSRKMRAGFKARHCSACTYSLQRLVGCRTACATRHVPSRTLDDVFPSLQTVTGGRSSRGNQVFVPVDWGNSSVFCSVRTWRRIRRPGQPFLDDPVSTRSTPGAWEIYDSRSTVSSVWSAPSSARRIPSTWTDEELEEAATWMRKQARSSCAGTGPTLRPSSRASRRANSSPRYAWNSSCHRTQEPGYRGRVHEPERREFTPGCVEMFTSPRAKGRRQDLTIS